MDVHFNAYKARYEILDAHFRAIERAQYVKSLDIFINLDDVIHILHRPNVNHEFQICGLNSISQCAANIINLIAHYKQWAAKKRIPCKVFCIYTSTRGSFRNGIYMPGYREYYSRITDPASMEYFFINDAIPNALRIAKNICDYVADVFMIDSQYLEPSIIPYYLKETGRVATAEWSMMVSRDQYDLQYAYKDKWVFVSPKGDNTRIVTRGDMWDYIADREHVDRSTHSGAMYHHDVFPLALTITGNKYRSIPRLRRIGWKTLFKYLDEVTAKDTAVEKIIELRLLSLLENKKVDGHQCLANLAVVDIPQQVMNMSEIDKTLIDDQLHLVTDHNALATINEMYFGKYPLNLPFLTASYKNLGPFSH